MRVELDSFLTESAKMEMVLAGMEETSEVRKLKELVTNLKTSLMQANSDGASESGNTDPGEDVAIEFRNVSYSFLCRTYEPSVLLRMLRLDRLSTCQGLVNWCHAHEQIPLQHWLKVIANNGNQ